MGGGNTGALGFFCLLVMLIKLSEFRHGLISRRSVAFHILAAFAICVLAEVKFVILLSPLLLAWVWLSPSYVRGMKSYDLKRLLLIALTMTALVAVAVMVLAASYSSAFEGAGQQGAIELFIDSLGYIFNPNHINPETGELGRVTTLFSGPATVITMVSAICCLVMASTPPTMAAPCPVFSTPCSTCCSTPLPSACCCGRWS